MIHIKRKIVIVCITLLMAILASAAFAYKTNLMDARYRAWDLKKAGIIMALDLKNEVQGSPGKAACVPVLMYHSINDVPVGSPDLSLKTESFDKQMEYLTSNGFTAIGFNELDNAGQYSKPVILTFDDGYEDNYKNAYPILKKYKLKATIFMVSGYIGSPGFLNENEMKEMSDVVSFQSHTDSHKPLTGLSEPNVEQELKVSKEKISKITNKPVSVLSYPNGAYDKTVLNAAHRFYSYAVTTNYGYYFSGNQKYNLRRIKVTNAMSLKDFASEVRP